MSFWSNEWNFCTKGPVSPTMTSECLFWWTWSVGQWWTKEGLFDCGALWRDTREPSWHAGENSFILWHSTVIKSQSYLLNLNVTSSPVLFQIIITPSFISFGARPQGTSSIRIWTITFWRPTAQKFSKTWLRHLVKKNFKVCTDPFPEIEGGFQKVQDVSERIFALGALF